MAEAEGLNSSKVWVRVPLSVPSLCAARLGTQIRVAQPFPSEGLIIGGDSVNALTVCSVTYTGGTAPELIANTVPTLDKPKLFL